MGMLIKLTNSSLRINIEDIFGTSDLDNYILMELSGLPRCYTCTQKCATCVLKGLAEEFKPPYPLPIREGDQVNPNTYNRWFARYKTVVYRWIRENFHPKDRKTQWMWAYNYPQVVYNVINSQSISNEVKIAYTLDRLSKRKEGSFVVLGHQRGGKTTTVAWFLENLHEIWEARGEHREIYFLYPEKVTVELPEWLNHGRTIDDVPNGSVLVTDEASIALNARNWRNKDNMTFTELSAIAGHKNIMLFYITQHIELLDTNLRQRLATDFILKPTFAQTSDLALSKLFEELKHYIPKDKYHTGYYDRRDGFAIQFWQPLPRDERLLNLSDLFSNYQVGKKHSLTDDEEEDNEEVKEPRKKAKLPRYIAYCDNDKFIWNYQGKNPSSARCPRCNTRHIYVYDTKRDIWVKVPPGVEHHQEWLATVKKLMISTFD